jgi:hypothetical protein
VLGGTTRQVREQIEGGFPYLPPGCAMQLDPAAQEVVLHNIQQNVGAGQTWLAAELSALGPQATLGDFLREAGVSLVELYANHRSFTSLRQVAFGGAALGDASRKLHARLRAILHVNDPERIALLRRLASEIPSLPAPAGGEGQGEGGARAHRLHAMAAAALLDCRRPSEAVSALAAARQHPTFRTELSQLLDVLEDGLREATFPWTPPPLSRASFGRDPLSPTSERARVRGPTNSAASLSLIPLHIHGRYRQEEVLAAFGVAGQTGQIPRLQAGVFYVEDANTDLLFVTLQKSEGFSPTTQYRDYAISPTRFHWESQNTAHPGSPTGRRYLAKTSTVLLFVRETQEQPNGVAEPYWFLGPVTLESASGERPMQMVWRLAHPMPALVYHHSTVAAG